MTFPHEIVSVYSEKTDMALHVYSEKTVSSREGYIFAGESSVELPIRSIDFYYPEFQAAHVLIFRDKSEICFLESANEAIFVHKLVRKAHRSVNTIKTGVFWTKHPLRPHWAPIHITNVYSIG